MRAVLVSWQVADLSGVGDGLGLSGRVYIRPWWWAHGRPRRGDLLWFELCVKCGTLEQAAASRLRTHTHTLRKRV